MIDSRLRVAFIGSRSLHNKPGLEDEIRLCEKVAYRFAELGIIGVSGLCYKGMDAIMQRQYSQAVSDQKAFLTDRYSPITAAEQASGKGP